MHISALYKNMGGDGTGLFEYAKQQEIEYNTQEAIKEYLPQLHDVADKGKRPDKTIFVPTGKKVNGISETREESAPVSRTYMPIQKYIISQKGSFARGNGVLLKPTKENSNVFDNVQRNWKENKTDFDLKEIGVRQMSETRCAVIFFGEKGVEKLAQFKYRYKIVSPLKGDKLYPFYDDDNDDFIAFGREYTRGKHNMYDFYFMNAAGRCEIWKYQDKKPKLINGIVDDKEAQVHERIVTPYTKLPIVLFEQENGECHDTDAIMKELEIGFSDFLTGMGYTADPILFGKGKAMDLPAKGTAGKFIETNDPDGDLKYITPDNATESRDLQFRMLIKFMFSLNRAVLLDLETLKGLGATSGAALERYLIDAYMEATDKQQGAWGKGIQRMVNWLTSQWSDLLGEDSDLRIDVEFTKYSLQDELEKVTLAMKANGNKPVVDHESSIAISGMSDDPNATLIKINEEQTAALDQAAKYATPKVGAAS